MPLASSASRKLDNFRAQSAANALIGEEKQQNQRQQSKPGSSFKNVAKTADIHSRLASLEASNRELREINAAINRQLEESNAMLQTTDRISISKIRNRMLLDMGRNKLAVICDYHDWKASIHNEDALVDSAVAHLKTLKPNDDMSRQWIVLGTQRTAIQMLLLYGRVQDRGDLSAKKGTTESILALEGQDPTVMISIFKAVHRDEPAH